MKIPKPTKEKKKAIKHKGHARKADFAKFIPYIIILVILLMGCALTAFGYFIFNREADSLVVSEAEKQLQDVSLHFDKKKIKGLFDASYSTSGIKEPSFTPKNPFTGF
ncbi:hypothetical protein C4544_01635 [candidate division WS5 bacterium]|uniref:Uncharacterized protein n=1 Tax=candidate division WS5 bacterium TaxID=2093353 RepID=A0A419DFI0_9BACT|nr:MAG: hypothetical protein C4544_01635 [candidate division WS5 bacterium]